jgi:hypothetical protein
MPPMSSEIGGGDVAAGGTEPPDPLRDQPAAVPGEQPPAQPAPASRPKRRARRLVAVGVLVAAGLASAGAGGVLRSHELGRPATRSEIAAAGAAELASRWQRVPAGTIFPAEITSSGADSLGADSARLVGIAPAASCSSALDPQLSAMLAKYGCRTVLRATYLDPSGTIAVTIGIAVLRSPRAASQADSSLSLLPSSASVQVADFPGTIASGFTNAQRAAFAYGVSGPYLFFLAGGNTDGRPGQAGSQDPGVDAMVTNLLLPAEGGLRPAPDPCGLKDVRC